jgi:cyclophilin family peptidyl-prolyl cis-trans isomerase
MKRILAIIIFISVILFISAVSLNLNSITATSAPESSVDDECKETAPEKTYSIDDEAEADIQFNTIAVIETNWGIIKFGLYEERAPITTANFIKLADERFYDGIKFHRIIDDFVIQTGDPNTRDDNPYNDGSGGSDQTIPLEIHPELTHENGAVGMARSTDPDSASSQFYICDGAQNQLDGDYAVFGITIEGIDVVQKIAKAETYPEYRVLLKDHPVDDIIMEKVYITEQENTTNESAPAPEKSPSENRLPGFETPFTILAFTAVTTIIYYYRKL